MTERLRRPAGIRSLRLGETPVTYVPDGMVHLVPRAWLPDTTDEVWATHPEYLDDSGNLVASIGGLLVERDGRALLIDAGFGPQSFPAEPGNVTGAVHGGALLDNLATLGRDPATIEAVAFTHLHTDHLGWAWHPAPGSDRPPFTSAEYLFSEPEWTHGHTDGEEIFPGVRVMFTRATRWDTRHM